MTRSLRRRHRFLIVGLVVVMPVLFGLCLAARRPFPVGNAAAILGTAPGDATGVVVGTIPVHWSIPGITTTFYRDLAGHVTVRLDSHDMASPDVLVYWSVGTGTIHERLPADARLLGAFSHRQALPIPEDATGETGRLLLYSLADHQVLALSRTCTLPRDEPTKRTP